jgi:hypothetical protein
MRTTLLAAACATALPTIGVAQGWELRAGLEQVSASVCSEAGACFGITCAAARGWATNWTAVVQPQADGAVPDPILAIRMDGARFALTSLTADGAAGRYTAPVADQDEALLAALQRGDSISVDPGRDFAVAEFSLRGSRWAMGEALDLCRSGGPEIFATTEENPATQ